MDSQDVLGKIDTSIDNQLGISTPRDITTTFVGRGDPFRSLGNGI